MKMTTTHFDSKFKLEIPSDHETYFQPEKIDGTYSDCRPISGSLVVVSNAEEEIVELNQLKIRLIRVVTTTTEQAVASHEPFVGRLTRWMTSNTNSKANRFSNSGMTTCSMIEELTMHVPHLGTDSQVGYSPDEGRIYKIPFHMPVPANLPPTSKTELGQVSYLIVAFTETASGESPVASQEIALCRKTAPENDIIQHTRVYPNSKVLTKIIMTQSLAQIPKSNIPLTAEVFIRQPTKPVVRPNEYKCVAVRGIQWRIEEISKTFYQPGNGARDLEGSPIEDRTSIKEIAKGFQKGYWKTLQSLDTMEDPCQCDELSVEITLDIALPGVEKLAPEIELRCYNSVFPPMDSLSLPQGQCFSTTAPRHMILTVEHQLKLDISLSEDTFDVCQHQLVDRKPLRTALNASFPLQIIDRAEGNIEELLAQGNPPLYEEVSLSPPGYERRK